MKNSVVTIFSPLPAANVFALGLFLFCAAAFGGDSFEEKNLLADPSFETLGGEQSAWGEYGTGFSAADTAVRVENLTADKHGGGAVQRIKFDPPVYARFRFGAKSRSSSADSGGEYAVYLDVHYDDGSALWGQTAQFKSGSHDWETSESLLIPERPIQEIEFFLLFRGAAGSVEFDDAFLERLPTALDSYRAVGGAFGDGSIAIRTIHHANDHGLRTRLTVHQQGKNFERQFVRTETGPLTAETLGAADAAAEAIVTAEILDASGDVFLTEEKIIGTEACDNGRGYAVWTSSAMERVFLHSLPEEGAALANPSASLDMARNEYESCQIAVLSPNALKNVTVEISPLTKTDDQAKQIAPENIQWRQVGYIKAEKIGSHPNQPQGIRGWWPDALLPVKFGQVPAGQTVSFWLTVFAPPETESGNYAATVTLRPENAPPEEIPLTVRVRDFTLPNEGLPTAFALMDGFLEQVYNKSTTPELRRAYGEFCLRHRLTPEGDISRTDLPHLDELLAYKGRGLGAFNLLNMVAPRGDAPWQCNSPVEWYTPENRNATLDRLAPLVEKMRENGLLHQAYIYTFDESNPEFHPAMTDFFGAVKERFPEVATFTTARVGTDLALLEKLHIDWTCPPTSQYKLDEAQTCRAAGKQVWSYICCGPTYPYANIMFQFPLIEARILGWQSFALEYDGLLYWGLNVWDQNNRPIDPNESIFLDWDAEIFIGQSIYGDGRLMYAGIDGRPIGSIRLDALRDGLEDWLYLKALSAKIGQEQTKSEILPVFESATRFTRSPAALENEREKIAETLEQK